MDFSHNSFHFMETSKNAICSRTRTCLNFLQNCIQKVFVFVTLVQYLLKMNEITLDINFNTELLVKRLKFVLAVCILSNVFTCNAFSEDIRVCRIVWYRHNDGQYWGNGGGGPQLGQVSPLFCLLDILAPLSHYHIHLWDLSSQSPPSLKWVKPCHYSS